MSGFEAKVFFCSCNDLEEIKEIVEVEEWTRIGDLDFEYRVCVDDLDDNKLNILKKITKQKDIVEYDYVIFY